MRTTTSVLSAGLGILLLSLGSVATQGQSQRVPSRITEKIDDTRTVQLKGNVHPLARPEFDRGAVDDSQPMTRMLLQLQRSPEQDAALQQMMDAQQTKGSASYRAWLTPEQFGKQFGPSDDDVQTVSTWLTQQGFQVAKVAAGRTVIEFSGNAGQVRTAFHTEIHKFQVNGETHIANVSEPAIPEALAPVVKGVVALHNFPKHSYLHNRGTYRWNRDTGEIRPLFTYTTDNQVTFAMGPGDFNKVYNVPPGATGAGQTIAVVSDSNIDANDVIQFRTMFGLQQNFTQANNVLLNGADPGLTGDEGEADLDVQWSGAIAPDANILLVVSEDTVSNPTQIQAGIDLSALYIVDNDPAVNGVPASVLSESFGECESTLGANQNIFYNTLWQQAAAEGITVVVSTGDSGSAGCDESTEQGGNSPNAAVNGVAVNGIASTPYDTAVGGTDFNPATTTTTSTYWNLTVGTVNSALGYIPETTWDDSLCAANFPQACTTVDPNGLDLAGGGGGISNCGIWTGANCNKGYAIPAYQVGVNKVSTTYRTIPDVSFFSSNGFNGVSVIYCQADFSPQDGNMCNLGGTFTDFNLTGGTSAATPPFAAIVALLNQATGTRSGNVNYGLYSLAANDTNYKNGNCVTSTSTGGPQAPNSACVFNDVNAGSNAVACLLGSTSNVDNSTNWCNPGSGGNGATYGVTVFEGTSTVAYGSAAGYDGATGLGSVNVGNLLSKWNNASRSGTTTTVSNLSGGSTSGSSFTATVTVSPSAATGNVAITALASNQSTILATIGGKNSNGQTIPYALSNGSVQVQTNLLPPGTAYISASYSGDATHAASTSAPAMLSSTVGGTNTNAKVQLSVVTFDSNGNPTVGTPSSLVYGSNYILNVVVGNNCGYLYPYALPPSPCPKGQIALTDNGNPLNDFPNGPNLNATNIAKLSNQGGLVEDQYVQLTGGSHKLLAAFTSADTNFMSGSSNTLSLTVNTAATTMTVAGGAVGTTVTLTAVVGSSSDSSQGPTGTIQFTSNGSNLGSPATCTPVGANLVTGVGASCTATLTTTISALYPPPTNRPGPKMPLLPLLFALLSLVLFALGWRWIPQNRRRAYVYAGFLVFALMSVGIAGCGGGGGSSSQTVKIGASYPGDTNYGTSSGSTTITIQ